MTSQATSHVSNKVLTSILLTIFVAVVGIYFIGSKQKYARSEHYISVEGYAEREVIADTVDWSMSFEHIGVDQQELEIQNSAEKINLNKILIEQGLNQNEIEIYNYVREDFSSRHRNEDGPIKYRVGYYVHVKSNKVDLVAKLKNNITKLVDVSNYGLSNNTLRVSCSDQEIIDREITHLAAQNAIERAKDLTKSLNLKLKKIISIETPNSWGQPRYPEMDGMVLNSVSLGHARGMVGPVIEAEDNASEAMTKRKVKASIKMKIAIK